MTEARKERRLAAFFLSIFFPLSFLAVRPGKQDGGPCLGMPRIGTERGGAVAG